LFNFIIETKFLDGEKNIWKKELDQFMNWIFLRV